MTALLLSHPHAAVFANGAAAGFGRAGMLAEYATGVAGSAGSLKGFVLQRMARHRPAALNRVIEGVAPRELRSLAAVELVARLVGAVGARVGGALPSTYDAMFLAHDAAVASHLWPRPLDAVYGYEDASLWTFLRARGRGIRRIWDLPLPHWRVIDTLWRTEASRWPDAVTFLPQEPEWKRNRKDAELLLADVISVASGFSLASLSGTGVRAPVVVTPYGFDTERFLPRTELPSGPLTFLAVGSHDLRKGTPYLLEAWRAAGIRGARLRLVGPMRLARTFLDRHAGAFEHIPYVARTALGDVYRAADVLVFPTLGDGFGLVIQEAMCCGVPVITTRCGGGPECVAQGQTGWIVQERNVEALAEALREAATDRQRLFRMGVRARQRAEQYTWTHAGALLAGQVASLLGGAPPKLDAPSR
jgi:glycosyltransferase involved in cell wall biosynthesis